MMYSNTALAIVTMSIKFDNFLDLLHRPSVTTQCSTAHAALRWHDISNKTGCVTEQHIYRLDISDTNTEQKKAKKQKEFKRNQIFPQKDLQVHLGWWCRIEPFWWGAVGMRCRRKAVRASSQFKRTRLSRHAALKWGKDYQHKLSRSPDGSRNGSDKGFSRVLAENCCLNRLFTFLSRHHRLHSRSFPLFLIYTPVRSQRNWEPARTAQAYIDAKRSHGFARSRSQGLRQQGEESRGIEPIGDWLKGRTVWIINLAARSSGGTQACIPTAHAND